MEYFGMRVRQFAIMTLTLYYIHDPMCSWCWGFDPVLTDLLASLPETIRVQRLLGGLAPDTDQPMPKAMRAYIENTWKKIQHEVPGIQFNFEFWKVCTPRRSTYPACRAVIASRKWGGQYDNKMTHAIQRAYYVEARNPSENSTLIELAGEIGLNRSEFEILLESEATHKQLVSEIALCRRLNAATFPSLVLQKENSHTHIPIEYNDCRGMLNGIQQLAENHR